MAKIMASVIRMLLFVRVAWTRAGDTNCMIQAGRIYVHKTGIGSSIFGMSRSQECKRSAQDELHLPSDLQQCHSPEVGNTYIRVPNLVTNPLEPACWDAQNTCAPFRCTPDCFSDPTQVDRMRYWTPVKPGHRKVMVFQYGKVASSSIVKGLKLRAGIAAAHVHEAQHAVQWLMGKRPDIPVEQQGFALSEEWSLKAGDECIIITASRSHFSRDPAEYFENVLLPAHPYGYRPHGGAERALDSPNGQEWTQSVIQEFGRTNVSALIEDFRAQHVAVVTYYSRWFSESFAKATGINVLQQPFDVQKKHTWVHGERCSALLLRYEDAKSWPEILAQTFPGFDMPTENRAEEKWYSAAYAAFKANLSYSEAELDAICSTETEKYFYSGDPESPCYSS